MFTLARLKLTAWYLMVIMLVSATFSFVIYRSITFELDRLTAQQQQRWDRRIFDYNYPEPFIDQELIQEVRRRVRTNLVFINLIILAGSGALGYYLSGKTLAPIAEMLESQYRFVSDASHELKTPLTAMRTSLEVNLRDKNMNEQTAKKTLQDNLDEVVRLQKLAEGLLELSHEQRSVPLGAAQLKPIIVAAVEEIRPLAAVKKIIVNVSNGTNLVARVEEASLHRAIVAILDNAVKYSPVKSTIVVKTTVVGNRIQISVKDQGKGITAKDLPHVTDRFYRAERSRSTSGHGLGLAIVKNTLEYHGGRVEIASKSGAGTTVKLYLPYSARIQAAKA